MKETLCTNRAYLGGLSHLSKSSHEPSFKNTISNQDHKPIPTASLVLSGSFQKVESELYDVSSRYVQIIRSQYNMFKYLQTQLGIQINQQSGICQKAQDEIEQIIEKSGTITYMIVQIWKTIQDREKQIQNMKEVVLLRMTQTQNRLSETEKENKELKIDLCQLQKKFKNYQGLKKDSNQENGVIDNMPSSKYLSEDLQKTKAELKVIRQQNVKNNQLSELLQRSLDQKQTLINQLLFQKSQLINNQKMQKEQLMKLQHLISLQKQQIGHLIQRYQKQLQQTTSKLALSEIQVTGLSKIHSQQQNQLESLRVTQAQYQNERQKAMKSLNGITLRVKEYQKQHTEQKLISDTEINAMRQKFTQLQQKYLGLLMRSAKWAQTSQILNLKIQNTSCLPTKQTQNKSQENQKQVQSLLKQFQAKSQARLNQLCRANQVLRKQNQSLNIIKESLVKKLSIVQNNNQLLRKELQSKNGIIKQIEDASNNLTSKTSDFQKQNAIKTVGEKIDNLKDLMKRIENGGSQSSIIDQSSIVDKCIQSEKIIQKRNSQDQKLENLFQIRYNKVQAPQNSKIVSEIHQTRQQPLHVQKIQHPRTRVQPQLNQATNDQNINALYIQTFPANHLSHNNLPLPKQNSYQPINQFPIHHGSLRISPQPSRSDIKNFSPTASIVRQNSVSKTPSFLVSK